MPPVLHLQGDVGGLAGGRRFDHLAQLVESRQQMLVTSALGRILWERSMSSTVSALCASSFTWFSPRKPLQPLMEWRRPKYLVHQFGVGRVSGLFDGRANRLRWWPSARVIR